MNNDKAKNVLIVVLIILVLACVGYISYPYVLKSIDKTNTNAAINKPAENNVEEKNNEDDNKISDLNFSFLQLENKKENKIYSPLSIKYSLVMLEAGAAGDSKLQISNLIENLNLTKYKSNNNMSLANALFIRDSFKDGVKKDYTNTLATEYNAEVIFDSFKTAKNINSWVNKKTLKLIPNIINNIDQNNNFLLINALGIDMEWKNKFLQEEEGYWKHEHENFGWPYVTQVMMNEFGEKNKEVSGMRIEASINNYDIVKELGEASIKETVGKEYRKWAKDLTEDDWEYEDNFDGDLTDENIDKKLEEYLYGDNEDGSGYIAEIDANYKRVGSSTDFSLYVDDSVKVFAKDLKKYNGTTLQYIGIMPVSEKLDSYIKNTNETKINDLISKLKEIKSENFKEGVATQITGYIPKFKFEYELKLKEDLKTLGITNVFEQGKANLINISDIEDVYIDQAIHKANIEFTQDGIKAAAATLMYGGGGGGTFNYIYDIPVEEIDLTFDKPYMFLIRDKATGEIWFVGTVYEPLSWEEEPQEIRDEF